MTTRYDTAIDALRRSPKTWTVTGAAGFIGSNLVEALLALGQHVMALDNFSTGSQKNLAEAGADTDGFRLITGDIRDPGACVDAVAGADYVLHQAALGSVPWSVEDPLRTHEVNVTGFLNMLIACRDAGVERMVYAGSSASYGDCELVPAIEDRLGVPLSPYAASKTTNEIYAAGFAQTYGFHSVGLRYFNVFGPRQDPEGAYAAVIPKWIAALLRGDPIQINGDGETTRDFCYVANVVQANVLAATQPMEPPHRVFNIACGTQISLNLLLESLARGLSDLGLNPQVEARHGPFRTGDVRFSEADIARAQAELGFAPTHDLAAGLAEAMPWYCELCGVTPPRG
ncbi:MAG: SDR family oxidoreductase [Pseudomonadota bacterium]